MEDDDFADSVVYIAEHGEQGALGLCINKPADLEVEALFAQLQLPLGRADLQHVPILWGGPVQGERGFILHPRVEDPATGLSVYASSMSMPDGLQMTTSKDILQALSEGEGPDRLVLALGYSAWGPGQLEDEIGRNSWLTVPAQPDLIFDVPLEQRHARAMALLGVEPWMLSTSAGRA